MWPESGANNPRDPINSLAPLPGSIPAPSPHAPGPPRGVVSRPHHGPTPSALTRAPDPLLLLKALQRRWLLAATLGLLVAAAAGSGVFFFMPPPKHTVRALLHVPPPRGVVFKQGGSYADLPNHQRTQVAMLRSRLVLNSALRDPKVAKLSIVQEQIEPVEWLEKEIEGDFTVAPEIMRISMKGDKSEQLIVLVDAIAKAYQREIIDNEKNQRRERLNTLRGLREKYEEQLREQRRMQTEIEQNAGGRDANARALVLSFERQNLAMNERLLLESRAKLREARVELELQEAHGRAPEPAISPALVDEKINDSPTVVRLLDEAEQHKRIMKKIYDTLNDPELHPKYRESDQNLKKVEAQLAAERKRLRPKILRELQEKIYGQSSDSGSIRRARVASLEEMVKLHTSEVERVRKIVENLSQNGSKLDAFRDDVSHIENLTKRLIGEEQALNVELEAPTEFKILEEAQILHADAKMKKAMMVAGSAGAALVAVLLAVGLWEFQRRRVNCVEDVSNDLGLRVVGVVPHSSPRLPRRLIGAGSQDAYRAVVLAESVDATRTLLLHLARGESAQVVMVTSANAGEGKTSLACHLAASMARMGMKTLLVDADLRNPTAHRLFEIDNAAGLSELLLGEADLDLVIRPTAANGLSLLPAGVWDGQVSRALAQGQARVLFDRLRKNYDFILVDSSPILPVADTLLIGQVVDAVIFSVLCEVSRLPSIHTAAQRMAALGIRNLGAIVNGVQGELYVSSYAYTARARGKVANEVSA
jgi:succinoglycan biosynthesis transport protein ExoP